MLSRWLSCRTVIKAQDRWRQGACKGGENLGKPSGGVKQIKDEREIIRSHTKLHSTPYMVTIVAPAAIVSREAPRYTIHRFGLHEITVGLAPFRVSFAKFSRSYAVVDYTSEA